MPIRILIVEDSQPMRQLLRATIAELAAAIEECADGAEALAAYARCRPDWVLMDIEMPGVDGITATRQIKSAFPEAKIVIVTHYGEAELREAARQAGATEYVLKEDLCAVRQILMRGGPDSSPDEMA